ncbi:MAG: S8 family serine peptidase [Candidatus Zixiibacteriota bacterium]|nr:MAG: S8 family serine peptidase [candidate division Zixibacteria bacterium]
MKNLIGGGLVVFSAFLLFSSPNYAADYFQPGVDYSPNAIVVVFKPDISPLEFSISNGRVSTEFAEVNRLVDLFGVSYMWPLFPKAEEYGEPVMAGYYSLTFEDGNDLEEVLSSYEKLPFVDHVEPVAVHKFNFIPNDPYVSSQWGLSKINVYNAWNINQGDTAVVLGIPDSGVDWDHPDLDGDIWTNQAEINGSTGVDDDGNGYIDDYRGWDWVTGVSAWPGEDNQTPDNNPMDFSGHGTHVAGIGAAETNNSRGVAGVGFDCRIMALRTGWLGNDGIGWVRMDFCSSAFYYAVNKGVKIINCSWGSSSQIASATNYAVSHGAVIITSAGNDGISSPDYLGARTDVIAVAGTDASDHKASFSNYGTWVEVSAPGVNIRSTFFNNIYQYLDGTSMAAPFVSGLAGLIYAVDPSLTNAQVRALIIDNADNIDALNPDYAGLLGSGRINAYNTLLQIGGIVNTPTPIYPINNEYINDPYPEIIWGSSDGAIQYHLMLGSSPLFSDPLVDDSTITDTIFVSPDSLTSDGTWYWKIRAGNGLSWSDFSPVQFFRLDITPPTLPVLISPADIWTTDQRPQFEWQPSTDNGSGMDKYILQVDDETGFSYPLSLEDSTSNTFYIPSFDLPSNYRYYWRVLARDNAGNLAYSAIETFGIDNSPPDVPVGFNALPDGWSMDPNFTIDWTNPADSSGIAIALYKIGEPPSGDHDTTGHFDAPPGGFMADSTGVYPIHLWLEDSLGNVSCANSASDTMFYDGSPPYGCETSSPAITAELSFTVSWSEGSDTGSGVSGVYDVRYKDGEAGSWVDWILGFSGMDSVLTGLHGHVYYFEARTYDMAGNPEPFTGTAESETEVDTTYTGPEYIPGDANNSGDVNGLDVIYLVRYLKGTGPPPDPYLGGDANGSCTVNGLDVTYLVAYFKGGDPPFAGNCD